MCAATGLSKRTTCCNLTATIPFPCEQSSILAGSMTTFLRELQKLKWQEVVNNLLQRLEVALFKR